MDRIWPWIAGVIVTFLLIVLVAYGGAGRQARYRAMGAYGHQTPIAQGQPDAKSQQMFMLHMIYVRGLR